MQKCREVTEEAQGSRTSRGDQEVARRIFFTGREYTGPHRTALNVAAMNIPIQTRWDLKWAWERVQTQLPELLRGMQTSWAKKLHGCCVGNAEVGRSRQDTALPTTRDAYAMRKLIKGLVVGPLDKSNGELWLCCPNLYNRALKTMYCEKTGYSRVYPAKLAEKGWRAKMPAMAHFRPHATQVGTERDLVDYMKRVYKANGWDRYATFNGQGGFQRPYIL